MGIKSKSKIGMIVWLFLCAYGMSGVLNAWDEMERYRDHNLLFWIYSAGAIVALTISTIQQRKNKVLSLPEKWKLVYRKIPLDLAVVIFVITGFITFLFLLEDSFLHYELNVDLIQGMVYHFINITIWFGASVIQGGYLYRRLIDQSFIQQDWKRAVIVRFVRGLRNAFLNRKVGTQVFLILLIVYLFGTFTGLLGVDEEFFAILIPAFILIIIPLFIMIVKRTGYFNKILSHTSALANGQYEQDLEIKGKSVLAKLAQDINAMKYGVRTSQQAQAKSERLKTELITNVSHDLRTPLTSIMTYTELLKNQDLSEDERHSYIEIVDRKSKRLKVLIEDLFEASKMASGNIELVKENVDIIQLLQQALAEYEKSIENSSVQFRVSNPETPIYAQVDGQKLWRVFDNLIGNILKYSLPKTRAYIDIKQDNGEIMISFKNISEHELSENIDELFERFKRGDESRYTEGSGLGLAISKSIIDLHGGMLDIEVEGDLFKVIIRLDSK